jgi:C4-dicarboxylate-specific signal transduction histidine kinase
MTIAFVVTMVLLALVAGYAARQMQDIQEKDATIEGLRGQVEDMRGKPSVIEERDHEIEMLTQENTGLRTENQTLRRANKDHESNLEMVLDKLGDPADESA